MEDLLFDKCRVCNVHEAQYTCPRCSLQTCSLPCSRRHKLWASCSGVRDPTVFKPKSQLATPSGIDHDYNFLHSIEHRIERSEKMIVEERALVDKSELDFARNGARNTDPTRLKSKQQHQREELIKKALLQSGTTVVTAPKGIRRNLENETSWSKGQKSIHWQVEWIRDGDAGRILGKAMAVTPIGEVYGAILEAERRRLLSEDEVRMEKKRRSDERAEQRQAKKARSETLRAPGCQASPLLQNPLTGAWNVTPVYLSNDALARESPHPIEPTKPKLPPSHHLYLLRPRTASCYPKVLVPLDPLHSLETILRRRTVLEFPTIYVLQSASEDLPEDQFMLERDFVKITGQIQDTEMVDAEASSNESSSEDSNRSTSGSDEDEEMDEGEIIELVPQVWGRKS